MATREERRRRRQLTRDARRAVEGRAQRDITAVYQADLQAVAAMHARRRQDEQAYRANLNYEYWFDLDTRQFQHQEHTRMATATPSRPPIAPVAPVVTTTPESPIICTSANRGALQVVLVGAGGTGARVIGPLTQMLRQGDHIAILDHDIVEDRNLVRQHFVARDIGQHKATVLAQRYARPGRIEISAHVAPLTAGEASAYIADVMAAIPEVRRTANRATVFIGCVDNALARQAIYAAMAAVVRTGHQAAWIDVGNETRGGQVLMTLGSWSLKVAGSEPANWKLDTVALAMPQMLRPAPEETVSCGERIDLQTVQVNHLSAAAAINCLSWLMLGIPFVSCGAFFSTLNTMQPIGIASADYNRRVLTPVTTYAMAAE